MINAFTKEEDDNCHMFGTGETIYTVTFNPIVGKFFKIIHIKINYKLKINKRM